LVIASDQGGCLPLRDEGKRERLSANHRCQP
jgi:hypothetical protein